MSRDDSGEWTLSNPSQIVWKLVEIMVGTASSFGYYFVLMVQGTGVDHYFWNSERMWEETGEFCDLQYDHNEIDGSYGTDYSWAYVSTCYDYAVCGPCCWYSHNGGRMGNSKWHLTRTTRGLKKKSLHSHADTTVHAKALMWYRHTFRHDQNYIHNFDRSELN